MLTIELNGRSEQFRQWFELSPEQLRAVMRISARCIDLPQDPAFVMVALMELDQLLAIVMPDVKSAEAFALPLDDYARFFAEVNRLTVEQLQIAMEALPELACDSAEIFKDVDDGIRAEHGIESAQSCLEKAAEVRRGLQ